VEPQDGETGARGVGSREDGDGQPHVFAQDDMLVSLEVEAREVVVEQAGTTSGEATGRQRGKVSCRGHPIRDGVEPGSVRRAGEICGPPTSG
jgi:hypothetical protein